MKKVLAGLVLIACAVVVAVLREPFPGPLVTVPALAAVVAAIGVTAWLPGSRPALPLLTGAVGVLSAVCVVLWLADRGGNGGPLTYFHTLGILTLITMTVRWSPARQAVPAAGAAALGEALLPLQVVQPVSTVVEGVAFGVFWSLGTAGAVGLGVYLRSLDTTRIRAVREARRAQRVELARDLHDFVAHDVSAMVIQAQAAQILLDRAPEQAAATLRAIEADGTRALAAMDRTVRMLREMEGDDVPAEPLPGLDDLPALVHRFAEVGFPDTELELAPPEPVPREVATTIYRVVVEALTNVRKHAPAGSSVSIRVTDRGGAIQLTVADRARAPEQPRLPGRSRPGVGLAGLAERVQALGGTFSAGRQGDDGWLVKAVFP
ncbi:sensor histidine kinase [Nonomuraea typhae]|uniref:sensor histidine kinase n=1 Tax=Nonomuraea typhae TaxID=2603600 RepID=UPI0012F9AA3A|nr:histidine kinase [Nonomuraea typhae]